MSAALDLSAIEKEIDGAAILRGIDLQVAAGECVVLLGASGCGKSTLLRLISGLDTPTRGRITLSGTDITHAPPAERDVAMVFQSYALYPHMTVQTNLGFALELKKLPRDEITRRVRAAAEMLELTPLLQRLPKQLSGGQRQRVAIGRAIVREPRVFLFDEPLSNLDATLRTQMRAELKSLHQRLQRTTIYVTHDQIEAMSLADRICVMNQGRVEQVGTPREIYDTPRTRFVAGFVGQPAMNFLPGELRGGGSVFLGEQRVAEKQARDGATLIGLRPNELSLCEASAMAPPAQIDLVEDLGATRLVHLSVGGEKIRLETSADLPRAPHLDLSRARPHFFDPASGLAL